jgi:hypothetical protein
MDVSMPERDVKDLQPCPRCAAPIDNAARSCWTCGHEIAPSEPAHDAELEASDKIPIVDWKEPEATTTLTVQPREAVPPAQPKMSSLVVMIAAAGVVACVTAMIVLRSLQPEAPQQVVEAARPTSAVAPKAPAVEHAPAPTWVGRREATWANDGSKTISFELPATSDITVWMTRVRPLLVVRCLYKSTEVFVAIHSAASIEGQSNHTVRIHIDDDGEQVQQWSDSVSGQELFSPNAVALARRLARAERMRFSFTPYNATPVTAEFSVQGFEKLAALVGNTCGWKLDGPTSPQIRAAGLN